LSTSEANDLACKQSKSKWVGASCNGLQAMGIHRKKNGHHLGMSQEMCDWGCSLMG
jgi:hypothetical protein